MSLTPEQLSVAAGPLFGIQLGRKLDAIIYLLQAYASNTQTASQLSTSSVGFRGVPDGRKFDIALYLLAQKAANGNSPTVLSVVSNGFKPIPEGRKADCVIYLLQQLTLNTQSPTQLSTSSATLKGIPDGRKPDVILYLLQKVAGNSQTPEQLSNASIGFNGVPEGRKPDIAIYLLNNISTGPPPPTGLQIGLVAYYRFEEAAGSATAVDATGNGHTLTAQGSPSDPASGTGILNNCRVYNPVNNQYFNRPDETALRLTSDFSWSLWVNFVNRSADMIILNKRSTNPNQEGTLYIQSSVGKFSFTLFDTTGASVTITYPPVLSSGGTWYHVVVTKGGTALNLYVDNVVTSGSSAALGTIGGTAPLELGAAVAPGFGDYWNGSIDEFGIWSRALTATEVGELYNSGAARDPILNP